MALSWEERTEALRSPFADALKFLIVLLLDHKRLCEVLAPIIPSL